MVRKSLKAIKAAKPRMDRTKIAATTASDIHRHMREDGETSAHTPRIEDVIRHRSFPGMVRKEKRHAHQDVPLVLAPLTSYIRNLTPTRNERPYTSYSAACVIGP